ncbi:MAG: PadR family transcriptional regulator [Rhodocyclaceae bacterium]
MFRSAFHSFRHHGAFHCMPGGHGGHGGRRGGFFGGFGDDAMGFGGRGFPKARKLASSDLQLLLLALLERKPSHGYELIKALEEHSGGFYAPSPGMVYPALTYLEEIGYADVSAEGSKKQYSITDAGRAHLDANRSNAEAMLERLGHIARKLDRVRKFFAGEAEEQPAEGAPELDRARHAVRAAVHGAANADLEEQRRVAAILMRAVEEIRRGADGVSA